MGVLRARVGGAWVDIPTIGPPGNKGDPGTPGTGLTPGPGVPAGGTTGQVLIKVNATDYNTQWTDNYADMGEY